MPKNVIIYTYFSNRNNALMSELSDFFVAATMPQGQSTSLSVKAFTPSNFRRYKLEALLIMKNICFRLPDTQGVFAINTSCKMVPKYVTQGEQSSIQKLVIYIETAQMVLQSEDKLQLQTLYCKLKTVISHKGFNDFFKPIKRLGKGAFATVYLIEHRFTKQRWAAKVFSREGQKLQFKGQQALQNQIRTLRFLSHPNVIQYEGVYETQNLIYLVTEYLSGGTLDEFMRNKSTLKGETVVTIIKEVLEALKYLEDNNVMHRDLKPQNILMREKDSKWVLADFGLSAFINGNHIYDKCGTMGYMAPEILSENAEERQRSKPFCSACDLYSFGIIAYNLIFGALPFKVEAENMFDRKIVWDGWKKPECEEVHPEVVTFLKGLLENNPSKRLTPSKALSSRFLTDKNVVTTWLSFHQKRMDERFEKILKMANIN